MGEANYAQSIDRGVELLKLSQILQSEKDGVDRPLPGVFDRTKTLDQFAIDVDRAVIHMLHLHQLIPMMLELSELGRHLHKRGEIKVAYGDDFSRAALDHFLRIHEIAKPVPGVIA